MCGSAVPHPYRYVPATGPPNRRSSLRRCGFGARQCNTAGGQRLRTAASGPGLLCLFQQRGGTPPINRLKILSWLLALPGVTATATSYPDLELVARANSAAADRALENVF